MAQNLYAVGDKNPVETKSYYNCRFCALAIYFKEYNRDINGLFLSGFGFDSTEYRDKPGLLNIRIRSHARELSGFVERYTGIETVNVECEKMTVQACLDELTQKEKYIGVLLDSYYCGWHRYYKQAHQEHFVVIVNWERKTNTLHILDPYLSETIQEMPMSELVDGFIRFFYMKPYSERESINIRAAFAYITDSDNLQSQTREKRLGEFFRVVNAFDYDTNYDTNTLDATNMVITYTNLLWNRTGFLEYGKANYKDFEKESIEALIQELQDNIQKWTKYRSILIKGLITRTDRFVPKLRELEPLLIASDLTVIDYIRKCSERVR
jgi:hypothetical protein